MSNLHDFMRRVQIWIRYFMKASLFSITGTMTVVVLAGVFFRYVLVAPLPWSEELARYLMVWGASLGASVAFEQGSHVAVTVLLDKFPGTVGKVLTWAAHIVIIVFMAVVVKEGFALARELRIQESTAMEVPMTWPYLAIPVGCLFILIQALIAFIRSIVPEGKERVVADLS